MSASSSVSAATQPWHLQQGGDSLAVDLVHLTADRPEPVLLRRISVIRSLGPCQQPNLLVFDARNPRGLDPFRRCRAAHCRPHGHHYRYRELLGAWNGGPDRI